MNQRYLTKLSRKVRRKDSWCLFANTRLGFLWAAHLKLNSKMENKTFKCTGEFRAVGMENLSIVLASPADHEELWRSGLFLEVGTTPLSTKMDMRGNLESCGTAKPKI
jgi:hypothetical protein